VAQLSFQSNQEISYASDMGRSSAGRPPHALVTFGFGGKLIVMKESSILNSSFGSQVKNWNTFFCSSPNTLYILINEKKIIEEGTKVVLPLQRATLVKKWLIVQKENIHLYSRPH